MNRDQVLGLTRWVYGNMVKMNVENQFLIPKEGPCIITVNHLSRADFPALLTLDRSDDIYCVAADSYKTFPIFGKMIDDSDMIWIDRTKADFTAMKEIMNRLKEGKIIAISPEGTRSKTQSLLEGKEGVTMIASKMNVPLVSIAIIGSEKWQWYVHRLRKPKITLRIGPAYTLPAIDRNNREESMRLATDEVMCRIAALLPDHYHGFYKGNPRIEELREEYRARGDMTLPEK